MKSIYLHPYFRKTWPVLVMAHRGGAGLAPENTMAAFQQAVEMGVDILELDVRHGRRRPGGHSRRDGGTHDERPGRGARAYAG